MERSQPTSGRPATPADFNRNGRPTSIGTGGRHQSECPAGIIGIRTLSLTDTGADTLADARTGKNGRHRLVDMLRQSVFGRLAGYEDVNDAERLCRDPAMRWVVATGRSPALPLRPARWAGSRPNG